MCICICKCKCNGNYLIDMNMYSHLYIIKPQNIFSEHLFIITKKDCLNKYYTHYYTRLNMKVICILFFFNIFINAAFCQQNKKIYIIDQKEYTANKLYEDLNGNIIRGKKIFSSRKVNCLSCHQAPVKEKFQGNLGPSLIGVGSKYNKAEIRLRVINAKIINPETIMPAYFVKVKYARTPKKLMNQTILSAQEVEDIVEYLYSLK